MGIEGVAASTAVDLVKNENIQNKAVSLLGMLFPYAGIEKRALDMYLSDVEKSNMSPESKLIATLSAKTTIKKLKNQKSIADQAVSDAEEGTVFDASSGVNQDWLERFMDSAGFVSEEQVQQMWGKILAKEFEAPGSTPHNMVRILSEITSKHAVAFQKICSMKRLSVFTDGNGIAKAIRNDIVVPYEGNETELRTLGLSFDLLNELETLGLIKFDSIAGFVALNAPKKGVITYIDGLTQEIESHNGDELPIGNVMLTEAGDCLCKIIQPTPIPNYISLEKKYMISNGVVFKEKAGYIINDKGNGKLSLYKIPEPVTEDMTTSQA